MATIYRTDVGVVIEITVKDEADAVVNISAATLKQVVLIAPDGTTTFKTGEFTTNGTDGKLRYTSVANDFAAPGAWRIRGYIEIGSTVKFTTSVAPLTVD